MSESSERDATRVVPGSIRRHASLAIVIVLGLVLVGFLRGIREPADLVAPPREDDSTTDQTAPAAVRYRELPTANLRPNSGWTSSFAALKADRPGPFDPVVRTEPMKLASLVDRARNRAFDTAPPIVPHTTEQMNAAACLFCHGEGLKVGDRIATKMCHPRYATCTQCHVESARPEFALDTTAVGENTFTGVYRAGPGPRASPGSPPGIPHTTWMRQDCLSCHGLIARGGLRTTHPWLTSCTQCHAPSAVLDQVAFPTTGP